MRDGRPISNYDQNEAAHDLSPNHKRTARFGRLNKARDRARDQLGRLPADLLALDSRSKYRVDVSERLNQEREMVEQQITGKRETQG